jgi:transcriptional regulator with XRE-family HTH domain
VTEYPDPWVRGVDARFGRRVRAERERRRISQQQLVVRLAEAHHLRWHQTTVAKVENGDRPVRLSEALAIAGVLDVSLADLLDDPDAPAARQRRSERLQARLDEVFLMNAHLAMRSHELEDELVDVATPTELAELGLADDETGEGSDGGEHPEAP